MYISHIRRTSGLREKLFIILLLTEVGVDVGVLVGVLVGVDVGVCSHDIKGKATSE